MGERAEKKQREPLHSQPANDLGWSLSNKNTTGCLSGVICKAQPPEGLGRGEESVYGEIIDLSLWAAFSSGNQAALGKETGREGHPVTPRGMCPAFPMGAMLLSGCLHSLL